MSVSGLGAVLKFSLFNLLLLPIEDVNAVLSVNPALRKRFSGGNREGLTIQLDKHQRFDSLIKNNVADKTRRFIRSVDDGGSPNFTSYAFNDSHYVAKVHWSGKNSSTILILMTDPKAMLNPSRPSYFYISRDYGNTFQNLTKNFTLPNGTHPVLTDFFSSKRDNRKYILVAKFHKYLFTTSDEGYTFRRVSVRFYPNDIQYHTEFSFYVAAHEKEEGSKMLYVSTNNGYSWRYKGSQISQFNWAYAPPFDFTSNIYFLRKGYYNYGGIVQRSSPWGSYYSTTVAYHVEAFVLIDQYMFVIKNSSDSIHKDLQISVNRGDFKNALFPFKGNATGYVIADASENETMVAVNHGETANLYISGVEGLHFSLSLTGIMHYKYDDDDYIDGHNFVDLYAVHGISGIYIATTIRNTGNKELQSYITFDKGGVWSLINPPTEYSHNCSVSYGCSLHISQDYGYYNRMYRFTPVFSGHSAPGFIIATGNVGQKLQTRPSVFFSRDAGLSWKKIFTGHYFYAFADHGGIIVGVKKYALINYLSYSYDEGNTWKEYKFNNELMHVYGLLTEPGEKTTIFTIFGSLPGQHSWILIQVNMADVLGKPCTRSDYKMWEVTDKRNDSEHCLLGKKQIFERREPKSKCYNGYNYDRPISVLPCLCTKEDYDCDFGFERIWVGWVDTICSPIFNHSMGVAPPSWCSPGRMYNASKGYRKVPGDECIGGVEDNYKRTQHVCPVNASSEYMFYATRQSIHRYDMQTKEDIEFDLNEMRNVISLDVDYKNSVLFYADLTLDKIVTMDMTSLGNISVLLHFNETRVHVEALAYDWLNGNLYYCDGGSAIIGTINLEGKHKKVILRSNQLDKPRGMAIHPKKGMLFWTDWGSNSQIGRADMDGSSPRTLINTNIRWPNSITVDYDNNLIYWTDAFNDKISSCDLNGNSRNVIISSDSPHPYAVTIFKELLIWDDWRKHGIFQVNKLSGNDRRTLKSYIYNGMDLKAFWPGRQKQDTSVCHTAGCKFLCFPTATAPGFKCTCPDLLTEDDNGNCNCPGNEQYSDGECKPDTGKICLVNQFSCLSGECIPNSWRCDQDTDCSDGSDENKEMCDKQRCNSDQFACSNGRCLAASWQCDGDNDCGDYSDERNCSKCDEHHFTCPDNRCINMDWLCDGDNDCFDGADERSCTTTTSRTLRSSPGPVHCQSFQQKCNTTNECGVRCNKIYDCSDMSDEYGCYTPPPIRPVICSHGLAYCNDRKECFEKKTKCDGFYDCKDGSDEFNCPKSTDKPKCDGFRCSSGKCLHAKQVCNQVKDCPDGEDENKCKGGATCLPKPFGFTCQKDGMCHEHNIVCNKLYDCFDFSDEDSAVCNVTARVTNLTSTAGSTTVKLSWRHAAVRLDHALGYIVSYIPSQYEDENVTEFKIPIADSYVVSNLRPCTSYIFAVALIHNQLKESQLLYTTTGDVQTSGRGKPRGAFDIMVYNSFVLWKEDEGPCYDNYDVSYRQLICNEEMKAVTLMGESSIPDIEVVLLTNGAVKGKVYTCNISISYEAQVGKNFIASSKPFQYSLKRVEPHTNHTAIAGNPSDGSSKLIWAIPVALVLVALLTGLIMMMYKYRRLQHSFLAFAARGGYTRQEDDFEDENMVVGFHAGEDAPMINRFSDDEPLVVG